MRSIEAAEDKMEKLIKIWSESYDEPNFAKFLNCLIEIDRFDVVEDVLESMSQQRKTSYGKDNFEFLLSSGSDAQHFIENPPKEVNLNAIPLGTPDEHIITLQDFRLGRPHQFDAFVLFDENDREHLGDIEAITSHLESKNYSVSISFFFLYKQTQFDESFNKSNPGKPNREIKSMT